MTSMSSTRSRRCPCFSMHDDQEFFDLRIAETPPRLSQGVRKPRNARQGSPQLVAHHRDEFVLDFDGSALHLQGFALALIGLVESSTC